MCDLGICVKCFQSLGKGNKSKGVIHNHLNYFINGTLYTSSIVSSLVLYNYHNAFAQ